MNNLNKQNELNCKSSKIIIYSIIFIMLVLFNLNLLSQIMAPILYWCQEFIFNQNFVKLTINPLTYLANVFLSIFLSLSIFLVYSYLAGMISYRFLSGSEKLNIISSSITNRMFFNNLVRWNLYRLGYVTKPIIYCLAATLICFLIFYVGFNFLVQLAGFNIFIFTFFTAFIFLSLIIFYFSNILKIIWNISKTSLGELILINEPDADDKEIVKKSDILAFAKRDNLIFHLFYLSFILFILLETFFIIYNQDISKNILTCSIIVIVNFTLYLFLSYFKSDVFINSLLHRNNRITSVN